MKFCFWQILNFSNIHETDWVSLVKNIFNQK